MEYPIPTVCQYQGRSVLGAIWRKIITISGSPNATALCITPITLTCNTCAHQLAQPAMPASPTASRVFSGPRPNTG